MNLLFVAYTIVQNAGGSLPIEALAKKINSGKQFKKADGKDLSLEEIIDLIQDHGKNIKIDHDGIVSTFFVSKKPISSLFWGILDDLRDSPIKAESVGIALLFYSRVSCSPRWYAHLQDLDLLAPYHLITEPHIKPIFITELEKLNRHVFFSGKLNNLINTIQDIEEEVLHNLFHKIDSFDLSNHEISNVEFAIQFQDIFLNLDSFSKSITYIPEFIREIICELAISKPFRTLYNPFTGVGEACTSVYSRSPNPYEIEFVGSSNYDVSEFAGTMNMILHQVPNFLISNGNPLIKSPVRARSVDCVICQPPFGGSSSVNDWQLDLDYLKFGRSPKMEVLYLQFILNILSDNGRAYVVLPEGFMFSDNAVDKAIRRYLLENDFIDSVISLPAGVYEHSRIRTNILVIDKRKGQSRRGKVLFCDTMSSWASLFDKALVADIARETAKQILEGSVHEMVRESVTIDHIAGHNYRLQVSLYVNSFSKTIRNLVAHDEKVVKIQDLVSSIKFRGFSGESEFPYIKAGNLSKDPINPYLNISEHEPNVYKNVNGKVIDTTSILIARVGGALNPTIFEFDGNPVVINSNVYVLPVDNARIDLEYFALELNSELVKDQLRTKLVGVAQQYYRYEDLLEIYVRLPEIQEQRKRVSVYQEQILAAKKKETQLLAEKISSQEDEIKVLSAMKHSFAQLPFKTDLRNIHTYLNSKILADESISWNDPISPSMKSRTVEGVFEGLNKMIDTTNELFQNMENLINCDPNKMEIENVKIHDFIKEVLTDIKELSTIDTATEGMNITVQIDKYQFKELITNFVMNAIRHGFEDLQQPKAIFFHTEYGEGGNWVLTITNNGSPFPADFSIDEFTSFGKKRSASNGSGIGGYIIDKVIKNHRGKFNINDKRKYAESEMEKYREVVKNSSEVKFFPLIWTVEFVMEFPFNFNVNA